MGGIRFHPDSSGYADFNIIAVSGQKMEKIKKKAHAKINLTLKITGRREDGYHELDMIFLELELSDDIEIKKTPEGIRLTCSDVSLPTDEGNLAYRAARLMMQEYGIGNGVDITIEKRIPAQAGLGGGSSNAACVLKCMNELFELNRSDEELEKLAVRLGADVPFFIKGGLARAKGIGEELEDLGVFPKWPILIVKPDISVSTPWAYRAFDEMKKTDAHVDPEAALMALRSGSIGKLAEVLGNDLEAPVIREFPVIGEIKKKMTDHGAAAAMMTGSGSAVFGLFDSMEKAAACAAAMEEVSFITKGVDRVQV